MRIAVIGGGISGMLTDYLLCEEQEVTVYEANDYIGGHTNTIEATVNGRCYALDTGFIVFNQETYPNFIKLMHRLDVPYQPSDMVPHRSSLQMRTGGLFLGKRLH
jgi:predicted NAD/FAD-binding protein